MALESGRKIKNFFKKMTNKADSSFISANSAAYSWLVGGEVHESNW